MTAFIPIRTKVLIWEGTRKFPTTVYDIDGPEEANLSAILVFKDMQARGLLTQPTLATYGVNYDLVTLSDEVYEMLPDSFKEIVDSHREAAQRHQDSFDTEKRFYETAMGYINGTQEYEPKALTGSPWGLLNTFRRLNSYSEYATFTQTEYTYYAYEDEAAARV